MANGNDYLVWVDCEMTGLDVAIDEIVEIAVIITDSNLVPRHEGLSLVIKPSEAALNNMGDFVREMHTNSGLINELDGGLPLAEAETLVLEYLAEHVPEGHRAPLAGNTIGTDRMFVARYMPRFDNALHYRNIDVSSLKELARRWFPRVYFNAPSKDGNHRALADIIESIRELEYYRRAMLTPEPGLSSDEAAKIAEAVTAEYVAALGADS
ncbi:MAG: oligoribonuclease [Actinobacteria bacterium]|nr:oligoribonuclease [Actinomycetota bacterium]